MKRYTTVKRNNPIKMGGGFVFPAITPGKALMLEPNDTDVHGVKWNG